MKRNPPYKDPSEAINHLKDNWVAWPENKLPGLSWRMVAEVVTTYMEDGETSKAEVWNVAHKKYRCPPKVAKALRKMKLLDDKRYGFFFRVASKEEYEKVKGWLRDETFSAWVRRQANLDNGESDADRPGKSTA